MHFELSNQNLSLLFLFNSYSVLYFDLVIKENLKVKLNTLALKARGESKWVNCGLSANVAMLKCQHTTM